jgi:hypothetical protein
LSRLPEKYRVPIVLCDLQDKSIKEAARILGWPQGTLAGRLARGRTILAKRLTRHGMMISSGVLAAVLSKSTVSACVPTYLVSSTVKAATLLAAGQAVVAGLISAKVAALAEGVVMTMLLNKLKVGTMGLVVLVMVAFGGGLAVTHATAKAQPSGESGALHGPSQAEPAADPKAPPTAFADPKAPPIAPPIMAEIMQFMFDTKVVEVEPDGHPRVITAPRLTTDEDQVAIIQIDNTASDFPNIAAACNDIRIGTRIAIKAKRVDAGKAQIDLTLSTCKVEKAEKVDTLVVGNGVRAVKEVDIGKLSRIVLSQDRQGKPQLWFELTVREHKAEYGPFPLPPANAVDETSEGSPPPALAFPSPRLRPAHTAPTKERNPENPGDPWPFINKRSS